MGERCWEDSVENVWYLYNSEDTFQTGESSVPQFRLPLYFHCSIARCASRPAKKRARSSARHGKSEHKAHEIKASPDKQDSVPLLWYSWKYAMTDMPK